MCEIVRCGVWCCVRYGEGSVWSIVCYSECVTVKWCVLLRLLWQGIERCDVCMACYGVLW